MYMYIRFAKLYNKGNMITTSGKQTHWNTKLTSKEQITVNTHPDTYTYTHTHIHTHIHTYTLDTVTLYNMHQAQMHSYTATQ